MIQPTQIQSLYNVLYEQIAKYIWPYSTIETLANLEVAVYTSFPDLNEISKDMHSLKLDLEQAAEDDEDLKNAIDEFEDLISKKQEIFIKIPVPMEVEEK